MRVARSFCLLFEKVNDEIKCPLSSLAEYETAVNILSKYINKCDYKHQKRMCNM